MDCKYTFRVVVHLALCGNHKGCKLISQWICQIPVPEDSGDFWNVILIFHFIVFFTFYLSFCVHLVSFITVLFDLFVCPCVLCLVCLYFSLNRSTETKTPILSIFGGY